MKLLAILGAAASLVVADPVAAQPVPAITCPAEGTQDVSWTGMRLLQGGKGYVSTPMGEVHYRLMGQGHGPVVLLLHQTPWSMIEFGEIQSCLAMWGVRSLAVDTPGYGMSDAPQGTPTIAQYADNLIPVLDRLHLRQVVVAGHHTGSTIAAAFAARHPTRTLALIMQGTPLLAPQQRSTRPPAAPPTLVPKADGSHLSEYYRIARDYAGDDPRTLTTATWSVIDRYQAGVNDIAGAAVARENMAADLARVRAPVLVLSDEADYFHADDLRAVQLFPRFHYTQFSSGGAHALMADPARWARLVAEFVVQHI